MPYFVKVGEVRSGSDRYGIGAELPPGIGDEAMVEAGAIEWREAAESKAEPPAPDLDVMDMKQLRAVAKAAGVNSFGKSREDLLELLQGVM